MLAANARFVVVSGLPASGKSTVGRLVSPLLDLPVLDKDDYLEALFPAGPVSDDERRRLSRQADGLLRRATVASNGAVVVSWWRREGSSPPSGTPVRWLRAVNPVEVYCHCPPEVAAERFLGRQRHPGHGDDRWADDPAGVIARFARLAEAGPLGIGPVVTVDTSSEVDPYRLARSIAAIA